MNWPPKWMRQSLLAFVPPPRPGEADRLLTRAALAARLYEDEDEDEVELLVAAGVIRPTADGLFPLSASVDAFLNHLTRRVH